MRGSCWDAATLQVVAALPGPVDDAAWIGDELRTLRSDGADATLVEWFASDLVPGDPLWIVERDGGDAVVTSIGGFPVFSPLE